MQDPKQSQDPDPGDSRETPSDPVTPPPNPGGEQRSED